MPLNTLLQTKAYGSVSALKCGLRVPGSSPRWQQNLALLSTWFYRHERFKNVREKKLEAVLRLQKTAEARRCVAVSEFAVRPL